LNPIQWILANALKLDKGALRRMGEQAAQKFLKEQLRARFLKSAPAVAKTLAAAGYSLGSEQVSLRGYTAPKTVHYIREAEFVLYRKLGLPAIIADGIRDAHDDKIVAQVQPQVTGSMAPEQVARLVADAEVELIF
jgi:hypothetical protein